MYFLYFTAVFGCFSAYLGLWPARGVWFGSLGTFLRSAHFRLELKAMAIGKPELQPKAVHIVAVLL